MKKTDRNHLSYRQQKKLMKLEHKLASKRESDAQASRVFNVLLGGIPGVLTSYFNSKPKINIDPKITFDPNSRRR